MFSGGIAREVTRSLKNIYASEQNTATLAPMDLACALMLQAWHEWLIELVDLPVKADKITTLYHQGQQALQRLYHHHSKIIDVAVLGELKLLIEQSITILIDGEQADEFIWSDKLNLADETSNWPDKTNWRV